MTTHPRSEKRVEVGCLGGSAAPPSWLEGGNPLVSSVSDRLSVLNSKPLRKAGSTVTSTLVLVTTPALVSPLLTVLVYM